MEAEQIAGRRFLFLRHQRLDADDYGLSRDDSVKFLDDYLTRGIYKKDPFQELDPDGVGGLMRIGIEPGARQQEDQDRNLRAAWRPIGERQIVPPPGSRLCLVFAVPPAGRATGGGAGRNRGSQVEARIQGCLGRREASEISRGRSAEKVVNDDRGDFSRLLT